MKRPVLVLLAVLLLLAGGAALWWQRAAAPSGGTPGTASLIGGPFTLTDQTGKKVSDTDFRGRYMLIYFGYTFCPEICPTELQTMTEAVDLLGPLGKKVVPILISIDPERDTVEKLAEYVPLFHKRLVGLTGSPQEIARAARAYRVYYAKQGDKASYEMDHSAIIYLMDTKGHYATHFAYGVKPEVMAEKIRAIIERDTAAAS